MSCLTDFDASELFQHINAREFSCVELMSAYIERINTLNPQINAIVALRPAELLLQEAAKADQSPRRGWLHGVPIAIKDLAETRGLTTTYGSPLFSDHIPRHDCGLVKRIRDAGAIIIGKTNTPEFGLGSHSYNPVYGTTKNPYNTALSAGGSSGGAAAALAARLLPVADGSDMMGSLRNPAAFNNVYGFRPSVGRIPSDKAIDTCQFPLATTGPMGRSIMDIARLLDTMVSHDPTMPWSLAPASSFADALQDDQQSVAGMRIGWIGNANGHYPMENGMLELCQSSLRTFESLGCTVQNVELTFDLDALFNAWCTLRSHAVAMGLQTLFKNPARRALIKPEAQWEIERGLNITAHQVFEASTVRSAWYARAAQMLTEVDALCLPSAAVFPFAAEQHWPDTINTQPMSTYHEWMDVVVPASIAGLPTIALPAGFNESGLPGGIQLMGRYGADLDMLRLGQAYHEQTQWPSRRPPT